MRFDLALAASEARSVFHCLFNHKSGSGFETKPSTVYFRRGDGAMVCNIRADWAVIAGNVLIC